MTRSLKCPDSAHNAERSRTRPPNFVRSVETDWRLRNQPNRAPRRSIIKLPITSRRRISAPDTSRARARPRGTARGMERSPAGVAGARPPGPSSPVTFSLDRTYLHRNEDSVGEGMVKPDHLGRRFVRRTLAHVTEDPAHGSPPRARPRSEATGAQDYLIDVSPAFHDPPDLPYRAGALRAASSASRASSSAALLTPWPSTGSASTTASTRRPRSTRARTASVM